MTKPKKHQRLGCKILIGLLALTFICAIIITIITAIDMTMRQIGLLPTYTPTPTSTNTPTPTNTPTATDTPIPTSTPVPTNTLAATDTPIPTKTPVPTDTPIPTNTPIATGTLAPTNTPIATDTPIPTNAPIPTDTSIPNTPATMPSHTPTTFPTSTATLTPPPATPLPSGPQVVIVAVNKRAEYVDIQNGGDTAQDLAGWHLLSERGSQDCPLAGILQPDQTLRIWALSENIDQGGYNCGFGSHIWNNEKPDAAILYDAAGREIDRK